MKFTEREIQVLAQRYSNIVSGSAMLSPAVPTAVLVDVRRRGILRSLSLSSLAPRTVFNLTHFPLGGGSSEKDRADWSLTLSEGSASATSVDFGSVPYRSFHLRATWPDAKFQGASNHTTTAAVSIIELPETWGMETDLAEKVPEFDTERAERAVGRVFGKLGLG